MQRRFFVRTGVLGTLGAGLQGRAEQKSPSLNVQGANSDLQVVVCGVRSRGWWHLESVVKAAGARLIGICDCDLAFAKQRRAQIERRHGLKGLRVFQDFREVCADPGVDVVTVCTPNHTHALIALTAAAAGKHVYVEKPVSHNLREGELLAIAAEKYGVVMTHGFQRRSETAWIEAVARVRDGELGEVLEAKALCFNPRKPIGKVMGPTPVPPECDHSLWTGPRELKPVFRQQYHYDWHWQRDFGNGDIGNQAPHQLDVCRWVTGDEEKWPRKVTAGGARIGLNDDGNTPNTALARMEQGEGRAPITLELRGLPKANRDWRSGMEERYGISVGNVIRCEGGLLIGPHRPNCWFQDHDGKILRRFEGSENHMVRFLSDIRRGTQEKRHKLKSGHLTTSLAHLINLAIAQPGGLSWEETALEKEAAQVIGQDEHLAANGLTSKEFGLAKEITTTSGTVRNSNGEVIDLKAGDRYRTGFSLPNVG